jgi:large subunit ribosomal protein L4
MELKKLTIDGKSAGVVSLNDEVFAQIAHPQTITDVVKAQLNNERQGTVSSKTRAEVRGGGRKPWRQKGTGRARQGSTRSPLWPGGGSTFGPLPRCYDHRPPKKVVDIAIRGVLSNLAKNDRVCVVDNLAFTSGKSRDITQVLKALKLQRALFVLPEITEAVRRASRNMTTVKFVAPMNVNTCDLLKYGRVVIAGDAIKSLEEVLTK